MDTGIPGYTFRVTKNKLRLRIYMGGLGLIHGACM